MSKGDWFAYDEINQLTTRQSDTGPTAAYNATSLSDTNARKKVTYRSGNRNRLSMEVHDIDLDQHYTIGYTPVDLNQYTNISIQGGSLGVADQFFPETGLRLNRDNNFNLKTFYGDRHTTRRTA